MFHHPQPEVAARPAEPGEIPRTAKTLIRKAGDAGWTTAAQYARGTTLPARGKETGKVVDSIVVRLSLPDARARAVAVWVDGRFDIAFRWARWLELEECGARDLGAWLTGLAQFVEQRKADLDTEGAGA